MGLTLQAGCLPRKDLTTQPALCSSAMQLGMACRLLLCNEKCWSCQWLVLVSITIQLQCLCFCMMCMIDKLPGWPPFLL